MNKKPTQSKFDDLADATNDLIQAIRTLGYSEKEYRTNEFTILKQLNTFQKVCFKLGFRNKNWLKLLKLKADQYYMLKVFTLKDTYQIYVN